MTARLATDADIPTILRMLAAMGQNWSPETVKERFVEPHICAVRETNKAIDGFCFYYHDGKDRIVCGPAGGPVAPADWLKCLAELDVAFAAEDEKRHPTWDLSNCWVEFTVWPSGCQASTIRPQIEAAYKQTARSLPTVEGYDTRDDGARVYHMKRATILAAMKALVAK